MLIKKTELLRVRLEPDIYSKLKSIAQCNKSSVSRYVRELIEVDCGRHLQPLVEPVSKPAIRKNEKRPKKQKQKKLVGNNGVRASSLLSGLLNKTV